MDAKTLRASILQMAIEGKLVPQLDEEPVVEQIGETPEEVPFEIPEKWKWMRLSDITSKISDGTHHSPVSNPTRTDNFPFLYITAKNIKIAGIDISSATFVSKEVHDEIYARCNPEYGDVLFIKDGATTGVVTQNTLRYPFSLLSSVALLKPRECIDSSYLVHAMSSPEFNKDIRNSMAGTGIPRVTLKVLKNILLPVPPVSEQRRIVGRLNELLPLVDKFGKAQEALAVAQKEFPEKLKASLLQEAIQGELVPQLDEEPAVKQIGEAPEAVPFAIPKKWKWVSLKNITRKIHYGFTASATSSGNCRLLRITDLKPSGMSWETVPYCSTSEEEAQKFSLKKNDIVIARTGGTIGKSFLIRNIEGQSVFASYLIRAIPETKFVNPDFLINFLSSPLYWSQLKEASRGTGQPNVNAKSLGAMWVPLPPIEEQHRIVARLNELLPLIKKLATTTVK